MINVIQPNIKQEIKWKKNLKHYHHQKLIDLSKINNNENNFLSKLNIWPETAFLGLYPRDKSLIQDLSQKFLNPKKNEFLFTGTFSNYENNYYNSDLLLIFLKIKLILQMGIKIKQSLLTNFTSLFH